MEAGLVSSSGYGNLETNEIGTTTDGARGTTNVPARLMLAHMAQNSSVAPDGFGGLKGPLSALFPAGAKAAQPAPPYPLPA